MNACFLQDGCTFFHLGRIAVMGRIDLSDDDLLTGGKLPPKQVILIIHCVFGSRSAGKDRAHGNGGAA